MSFFRRLFKLDRPDVLPKGFDYKKSLTGFLNAADAYRESDDLAYDEDIVLDAEVKNTRFIVRKKPEGVLEISFRGTAFREGFRIELESLLDADMVRPFYPHQAEVHHGFLEAFLHVKPALLKAIHTYSPKEIRLSGHSKGGAIATIAAIDFRIRGYNTNVYTYGSPKLGNRHLDNILKTLNITCFNVVIDRDAIPGLPTKMGYKRHGTEIRLSNDGRVLRRLKSWQYLLNFFNWMEFKDHFKSNYLAALLAMDKITEKSNVK